MKNGSKEKEQIKEPGSLDMQGGALGSGLRMEKPWRLCVFA
jgi:hypothetical protein